MDAPLEASHMTHPWFEWMFKTYASYPWIGLLLLMMAIDILSGVTAAVYQKQLSSKIGYRGMMKKACVLLVIGMAAVIEQAFKTTLPEPLKNSVVVPIAKLTAGFFLFNEALSVLENAKRAGVPLPAFLSKSLVDTLEKLAGGKTQDKTTLVLKEAKIEAVVEHEQRPVVVDPTTPQSPQS